MFSIKYYVLKKFINKLVFYSTPSYPLSKDINYAMCDIRKQQQNFCDSVDCKCLVNYYQLTLNFAAATFMNTIIDVEKSNKNKNNRKKNKN